MTDVLVSTCVETALREYLDKHPFQQRLYRGQLLKNAQKECERIKKTLPAFTREELTQAMEELVINTPEYDAVFNTGRNVAIRRDQGTHRNVKIIYDVKVPYDQMLDHMTPSALEKEAVDALMHNEMRESVLVLKRQNEHRAWKLHYFVNMRTNRSIDGMNFVNEKYEGVDVAQHVMRALTE